MINFLHTFQPQPVLISFGSIQIFWYGLFIVSGILAAILIALKLAGYYNFKKNVIFDLFFWLIIGGIIGARIYHIFLELPFYIKNPLDIFKIWQGGLAIHGAIIVGLIIVYIFAKKEKVNFFFLAAILLPGLALGQAIGRWGNYFNQELFGRPTDFSWGIPINTINRPIEYISSKFFHPTFLYESFGNLIIFLILFLIHICIIKKNKFTNFFNFLIFAFYLISYSVLRFFMEFIRIDKTPLVLGLRWPQVISLAIIVLCVILIIFKNKLRFFKITDKIETIKN